MIDFKETHHCTRKLLARALSAGSSTTTVGDEQGRLLDHTGSLAEGQGDVCLRDLQSTANGMGLSLSHPCDATLIWGLRNAVYRDENGGSWLPSLATKLVRKTHHLTVEATYNGDRELFAAEVSPDTLCLRSLDSAPSRTLIAVVDWNDFVRVLASDPDTRGWRTWLHSPAISFRNEPFWLRIMLKLL